MNNTFLPGVPTNGHVGPTRLQRGPHIFPPDLLFADGFFFQPIVFPLLERGERPSSFPVEENEIINTYMFNR